MATKFLTGLLVITSSLLMSIDALDMDTGKLQQNGHEVLQAVGIPAAGNYGCWCRRIGGNPVIGAAVVNEVDAVCKRWFQARRCITLTGGSCAEEVDSSYSASNANDYKTVSGTTQCGTDTGMVDIYFANLLKQAIDDSELDIEVESSEQDCRALVTPMAKGVCTGTVPDSLQTLAPPIPDPTTVFTPNHYNYLMQPNGQRTHFKFKVDGRNDAHVMLEGENNTMFEIVIGGWGNRQSVIRPSKQGTNMVTVGGIGFRKDDLFLIDWSGNDLVVNKNGTPFMTLRNYRSRIRGNDIKETNSVGISTGWGSTGYWTIYHD